MTHLISIAKTVHLAAKVFKGHTMKQTIRQTANRLENIN